MMGECSVTDWTTEQTLDWANREGLSKEVLLCIRQEKIDGKCLLTLCENDIKSLRDSYDYKNLKLSDIKKFWLSVRYLQKDNHASLVYLGLTDTVVLPFPSSEVHYNDIERISPPMSVDGRATSIQPEFFKTMISLGYAFLVTWITAFVMVVVHERVPDMKRYPPLPDIFLDNVPHIPWAFHMCEITGTLLCTIWLCVIIVHKHRLVLLRRFFALAGTVFLLRCVTMLITSLSVPGTHLQCNPHDHKVDENSSTFNLIFSSIFTLLDAIALRIQRAYTIWSGLGMSIQGVRTCGDYMFSGHTVALTLLNFFITEYTPRHLYFLHTLTWLLNMFGIFFILAAHEHYSIDVFVAFYITSRLFLYYHTLANNQALMSHDSNRTRIWFPMFSYFESSVDGIIPNEFDTISDVFRQFFWMLVSLKDVFMLTARRFWISHNQFTPRKLNKNLSLQSPTSQSANFHKNLNNQTNNINRCKKPVGNGNLVITNNDIGITDENIKNIDYNAAPNESSIRNLDANADKILSENMLEKKEI